MKKLLLGVVAWSLSFSLFAQGEPQEDTTWKTEYRATATRINDLVHTKLDVTPDFSKSYVYGKAWITLHPHFYSTDSLNLDAKGMEIKKVVLMKGTKQVPLVYSYDDFNLRIQLDKTYKKDENYTVYIEYTAKPDEFEKKYGNDAMLGIKGFYFINPKGEDKDKPTQIWTQGETEANSAWFPTIDKQNQKTTEELTVTVDNKYVTLSNGKLMSQKKNANGTRTDYWKMDLPHAPYLFFLGVGEYAVIKDSWKGKEVNYYVEKPYASVAKKIFGDTPEMIGFFSDVLGVEFPWVKYSQITGRDYVAGAMENTTATIHQETAQQDARQLLDGNIWESTIAHELFHQWFGDLVTTESWSNLTLNESFADFSETLWAEHKYGQDAGDEENYNGMQGYLRSHSEDKDLVRFYYSNREDMFDAVSYQKGGRVLNMLRHFVGNDAFFKSLNLYLTTYRFKSAEAQQLRLAFEEVTGRDLNWFFNQWYYGSGHPVVDIDYVYDDAAGKVQVIVHQTQPKLFQLPIAIDIYSGGNRSRENVWASHAVDTFTFKYSKHPDLVNVDADKITLWDKEDHKTLDNYIFQYGIGNYVDRREAIAYAAAHQDDPKAVALLNRAIQDKYDGLRTFTIVRLDLKKQAVRDAVEANLLKVAQSDPKRVTKGAAINALGFYKKPEYVALFNTAVNDSSYTVAGDALMALNRTQPDAALPIARKMADQPLKGVLSSAVSTVLAQSGDESLFEKMMDDFQKRSLQSRFSVVGNLGTYLANIRNTTKFKQGVDAIVEFRDAIPEAVRGQTDPYLNGVVLKGILTAKDAAVKKDPNDAAAKEQFEYIKSVMPEADKKGF